MQVCPIQEWKTGPGRMVVSSAKNFLLVWSRKVEKGGSGGVMVASPSNPRVQVWTIDGSASPCYEITMPEFS